MMNVGKITVSESNSNKMQRVKKVFPDLVVDEWGEVRLVSGKLHHNELVALVSWQRKHKLYEK